MSTAEGLAQPDLSSAKDRFFRPADWVAFWAATLVTFGVYFYTLAPTVSLEDSGELAVAGDFLGVPHPPGYPIWSLIVWFFSKVFGFVTFRGQPNPAWSIALASAVFGALAAGLSAMLISRSGSHMLQRSRKIAGALDRSTDELICAVGGIVCSLVFAFSPVEWSQSVIVEVYALGAFFLVLVMLLTYKWMCRPTDGLLYMIAFVFGLGLTNYQVLLLAALPLAFAVFLRDIRLFRDFLITATPYMAAIWLLNHGKIPELSHPLNPSGFVYMGLNVLVLALAWIFLPRGRTVALSIACAQAGVAFYIYMPIVSDLRNPPMNWGYPRTWEGFKHAISRGQYEKIVPTNPFTMQFLMQIGDYMSDLRRQFTLPVVLLGFLPFTTWRLRLRRTDGEPAAGRGPVWFNALFAGIVLSVLAAGVVLVEEVFFPGGIDWVTYIYKTLVACVLVLVAVGGIGLLITQVKETVLPACVPLLEWLGFSGLARAWGAYASAEDGQALDEGDTCEVTIDSTSQKWVIATLLAFLAMSLMLIWLANPKGDIQDAFIQRVKFIASHSLYSYWIGYGLIFGLAAIEVFFRGSAVMRVAAVVAACLIPLIPLQQNYYNRELIRVYGGAEQNGHDYGWQFGNYQLRGAEAILEEREPDEEPLPDPSYPPPMEPNAIFFGGTDPGRFVPTYMIYSAKVREDVYLITQNALADNTYMNVMRDLYGDQIWIPAVNDSGRSFQRYVDEVQSGKRPRNADLKIEGGRVSVQGALGVMEINGILAEMIFEHNKFRHAFYVEESYVIRWMYPYLSPHGLIMRINANHTPLASATPSVVADMDFWDWYTRRLAGDEGFIRDVVARKSFSKLRSALAGLYANRGLWSEAERAFQQARILYPLSPEANFRLAQEVLVPHRRFGDAIHLMEDFYEQDPGNDRIPGFVDQLKRLDGLMKKINEFEAMRATGKPMDVKQALELADCYLQMQQRPAFVMTVQQVLAITNMPFDMYLRVAGMCHGAQAHAETVRALDMAWAAMPPNRPVPPNVLQDIARLYASAGQYARMEPVIREYLKRVPADWRAWMDLAAIQISMRQTNDATRSLENALRQGGDEAVGMSRQDKRFDSIRNTAEQRAMGTGAGRLPGIGF
jgi:Flp pilus assembly protein TadD